MRTFLLFAFLTAAVSSAGANSIAIGQIQFLGTNSQGVSAFKVILDTTGVTASALTLRNLKLIENGSAESTGNLTSPVTLLFLAGAGFRLPPCPCKSAEIELSFPTQKKTFALQLANGELFVTRSTPVFFLRALPHHRFLIAGQSEPLVLTSVPEPASLTLFSGGLALLLYTQRSSWCDGSPRIRRT
jgi:hypothetical protein